MDIDRVRYFHVFSETGSLVKASEILHISQPALSKALRLLEHEVGAKLLEPEGRGLRLSHAGLQFKQETETLLGSWMNIPEKIRSGLAQNPTRIGSFEVFTTYFLSQLTKFIELESLELHEFGPGHLEEAIAGGKIDIGITYVPIPKAGIEYIEVAKIKMGVFGLSDYKEKAFVDIPFVVPLMPSQGTPSKVIGLDGWPDHKITRKIKFRVTMMESAMELCRLGLCAAYLPEFVVHLHNEKSLSKYKLIELGSPIGHRERLQSVYLVQRKQTRESKLHRQIAKSLRSLS